MDAYKKLVLVQLLADGKTSPVPKYTPQPVTRTYRTLAQPYLAFTAAYERYDAKAAPDLHQIVDDKKDAFEKVRSPAPPTMHSKSPPTLTIMAFVMCGRTAILDL